MRGQFRKRAPILAAVLAVVMASTIFGVTVIQTHASTVEMEDMEATSTPTPTVTATPTPTPTPTPSSSPTPEPEEKMVNLEVEDDIMNVLLLGMDARSYDVYSRSDTMIVASYNKTKHEVKLTSFMRDSWVEIPGYGWNRLNAATAFGGPELLIDTLTANFDIKIDHYAQIKFDDFKEIIDIIGGVDVQLTEEEVDYINNKLHTDDKDYDNDILETSGLIHLNGAQALWHCRNRSVGNSDYERTDRQRDMLETICNTIINNFNLDMAVKLIPKVVSYVDTDMGLLDITNMGIAFLKNGQPEIENTRVPFEGLSWGANINGASVIELDMEATIEELHSFLFEDWTHIEQKPASKIEDAAENQSDAEKEQDASETVDPAA